MKKVDLSSFTPPKEAYEDNDWPPDYSGRIIFGIDFVEPPSSWDDAFLQFFCGPETKEGYLSDCLDVYDKLKELFSDYEGGVDIGVAENVHAIYLIDKTEEEIIEYVRKKLVDAGAVEMER